MENAFTRHCLTLIQKCFSVNSALPGVVELQSGLQNVSAHMFDSFTHYLGVSR